MREAIDKLKFQIEEFTRRATSTRWLSCNTAKLPELEKQLKEPRRKTGKDGAPAARRLLPEVGAGRNR